MKTAVPEMLSLGIAFLVCASCASTRSQANMADLMESLDLRTRVDLDVECPLIPPDAERVLFAGVFANTTPIRPPSPEYPEDFCPEGTQFYARADGRGNSTLMGEYAWHERYCAIGGFRLVAEGYFEASNGDRLTWKANVHADPVPPAIPNATFAGEFEFTGGTGAYARAVGEAKIAAKQLGDAPPGQPAGSTAAAICGWIIRGSA